MLEVIRVVKVQQLMVILLAVIPPGPVPGRDDTIDKFSFSTDANATDIGQLSVARNGAAGQSSTTHGYTSGGYEPAPVGQTSHIDKFPFASDFSGTATDVGDLVTGRYWAAGQQY